MNKKDFQKITGCNPEDIVGEGWESIISEWNFGTIKIG